MANFTIETRFDLRTVQHADALLAVLGQLSGMLRQPGMAQASDPALAAELGLLAAVARAFEGAASPLPVPAPELSVSGDVLTVTTEHGPLHYPWSLEKLAFFTFLSVFGHERWLRAKYTLPGFVDLTEDDVVIDCGSFVGGFARAAAERVRLVHAVEPSRRNAARLDENVTGIDEVTVHRVGLGPMTTTAMFQDSSTGVDSSLANIDEGVAIDAYEVEVLTLPELIARTGQVPTFLKLEAEGLELGILRSLGEERVDKIAIDGSPENNSDDKPKLIAWLEVAGYDVYLDRNMVYGQLRAVARGR